MDTTMIISVLALLAAIFQSPINKGWEMFFQNRQLVGRILSKVFEFALLYLFPIIMIVLLLTQKPPLTKSDSFFLSFNITIIFVNLIRIRLNQDIVELEQRIEKLEEGRQ